MKDYHVNIFFSEDDGGYIADIPDLPHCSAFGETPEQALAEVLKAKIAWIEAAQAEGNVGASDVIQAGAFVSGGYDPAPDCRSFRASKGNGFSGSCHTSTSSIE